MYAVMPGWCCDNVACVRVVLLLFLYFACLPGSTVRHEELSLRNGQEIYTRESRIRYLEQQSKNKTKLNSKRDMNSVTQSYPPKSLCFVPLPPYRYTVARHLRDPRVFEDMRGFGPANLAGHPIRLYVFGM